MRTHTRTHMHPEAAIRTQGPCVGCVLAPLSACFGSRQQVHAHAHTHTHTRTNHTDAQKHERTEHTGVVQASAASLGSSGPAAGVRSGAAPPRQARNFERVRIVWARVGIFKLCKPHVQVATRARIHVNRCRDCLWTMPSYLHLSACAINHANLTHTATHTHRRADTAERARVSESACIHVAAIWQTASGGSSPKNVQFSGR